MTRAAKRVVTPPERATAASVTAVPRSLASAISPTFAGLLLTSAIILMKTHEQLAPDRHRKKNLEYGTRTKPVAQETKNMSVESQIAIDHIIATTRSGQPPRDRDVQA